MAKKQDEVDVQYLLDELIESIESRNVKYEKSAYCSGYIAGLGLHHLKLAQLHFREAVDVYWKDNAPPDSQR